MFATFTLRPNRWDWALLPFVLAALLAVAYGASQMALPIDTAHTATINLAPAALPGYLLRTLLRMFIALAASLLFAIAFAAAAARYELARRVLLPLLDVLQSVPILGFQAVAVLPFIALFPGSQLGLECAAIFAIFTSQAWNMAFSLYRSMRSLPAELEEASHVFRLSSWQRFWRLELPFAMPNLVWNMMMSMSGGWFFLVAAEAISVAGHEYKLPGIGAYIATAIDAGDARALAWALCAMCAAIVLYDQLFFAPLLASTGEAGRRSWLLDWLRCSHVFRRLAKHLPLLVEAALARRTARRAAATTRGWRLPTRATGVLIWAASAGAAGLLLAFIHGEVAWHEAVNVLGLGLLTALRVLLLTLLASLLWVPIAVWIGLRPPYAQRLQAVAQLLAAVPLNLLFPAAVYALLHYHLNPDIWLSPLMVFGTQWYILFNVVAGASTLPGELRLAAANLGLRGWLKWKRVYLPAVFPSYVTGAMTACGGSWNASIVAEYVSWGKSTLVAHGLGSYIRQMTDAGDGPRLALGISVMCIFVLAINRFVWSRLVRE